MQSTEEKDDSGDGGKFKPIAKKRMGDDISEDVPVSECVEEETISELDEIVFDTNSFLPKQ